VKLESQELLLDHRRARLRPGFARLIASSIPDRSGQEGLPWKARARSSTYRSDRAPQRQWESPHVNGIEIDHYFAFDLAAIDWISQTRGSGLHEDTGGSGLGVYGRNAASGPKYHHGQQHCDHGEQELD
jgi:hypothetical protein